MLKLHFFEQFLFAFVKAALAVDEFIGPLQIGVLDTGENVLVGLAQPLVVGHGIALGHLVNELDVVVVVGVQLLVFRAVFPLADGFLFELSLEGGDFLVIVLLRLVIGLILDALLVHLELLVGHHDNL